ncbi:hypothetical protein NP493_66g06033 [Ridgeia piscesae]|uniref:IFT140 first beta-propeller domain-containing protein n=1 Tax=Ridgeia piscesae TaxID=27915 RepID=A0AAD9PA50_RIDPI|nr:hypothetical protein NP493_66g06033 [Ridgeia piscesae]
MAVYFDHRAQAPHPGQNTDIQWHTTAPLLAVASQSSSTGGSVNLYREEGEYVQDGELRKSRPASVLAWHPTRKILAVGWETGELTILNEQEHEKFEAPDCLHKSEITILHWTSNGTRLLSGDAMGVLVVWKADTRGRLQQQPLSQQNLQEQLTEVVLKPQAPVDPMTDIASLARAAVSGDESALDMFNWKKGKNNMRMTGAGMGSSEALTFFVGGKNGECREVGNTALATVASESLVSRKPDNCQCFEDSK